MKFRQKFIWTAAHFDLGIRVAAARYDRDRLETLWCHGLHSDHCGGYDVAAWPCPPAAKVLDELLPDGAA